MNSHSKRRVAFRRVGSIILLGLSLGFMLIAATSLNASVVRADGGDPPPPPQETKTPDPPQGDTNTNVFIKSVTQIFHHLVFPANTISEALGNIFMTAANANEEAVKSDMSLWTSVLVQVVQAPAKGSYSDIARSSLKVAGSLAIALFILRLTMYQWNKLLGREDSPLQVLGDWLTAGLLAVVCGPFLDMIVRLGWWMMAAVLGETSSLAKQFVTQMTFTSFVPVIQMNATVVFLQGLVAIALGICALLALAAMIFAFGVAQATLFVLAVLGPTFAVASVIPEMKWLRSLWLKGVVLIAIMPVMAGGIFKAGILASSYLSVGHGVGLMSGMIRILWMFGAAGLLLTTTGILGKVTLGAAGEALQKMWDVGKGIVGTVALVGAVAATGGVAGLGAAPAAGGGAVTASSGLAAGSMATGTSLATGSALTGGGGAPGPAAGGSPLPSAASSLDKAGTMNNMSNIFSAIGLPRHASVAGGLAHGHEIEARQAQLQARIVNFGAGPAANTAPPQDIGVQGVSAGATQNLLASFGGPPEEFRQVFPTVANALQNAFPGSNMGAIVNQYASELGNMTRLYQGNPDYYNSRDDVLLSLAQDGHHDNVINALSGRPI